MQSHPANDELKWIENLANLMDSKFSLPGTKFKFGIDPILGLIPVVGDISSFLISGLLVMVMARHGVSRKVIIIMSLNIILDATVGSIPLLGNVFDFIYKANDKNISLLKKHYGEGKYKGSGNGILIGLGIFFLVFLFLLVWGIVELIQWIINLF